ncbi:unnamed protein product, partial [marine sediment metagenome]
AKNLEEALTIIGREKNKETEKEINKKGEKLSEKTFTEKQIKKYSDELLQFMGTINWDQRGISSEDISNSHPFKSAFDAIAIIKGDIDDLFQERKQAEKKLHAANQELEEANSEMEKAIERANRIAVEAEITYVELDQIFNASADGMWVIDDDFDIVRINKTLL